MAGVSLERTEEWRLASATIGIPAGLDPMLDSQVGAAFHAALDASGAHLKELAVPGLLDRTMLEAMMDLMLYEFHDLLRAEYRSAPAPEASSAA